MCQVRTNSRRGCKVAPLGVVQWPTPGLQRSGHHFSHLIDLCPFSVVQMSSVMVLRSCLSRRRSLLPPPRRGSPSARTISLPSDLVFGAQQLEPDLGRSDVAVSSTIYTEHPGEELSILPFSVRQLIDLHLATTFLTLPSEFPPPSFGGSHSPLRIFRRSPVHHMYRPPRQEREEQELERLAGIRGRCFLPSRSAVDHHVPARAALLTRPLLLRATR